MHMFGVPGRPVVVAALVAAGAIVGLMTSPVRAQHLDEAAIDVLLEASGLVTQIEHMPGTFSEEFGELEDELSPAVVQAVKNAILDTFQPQELLADIRAHLAGALEPDAAELALRWLESPLGARITRLEAQAASDQAARELDALAEDLSRIEPDRVALMRRLDAATGATEFSTDLALYTALGVSVGLAATQPADGPIDVDTVLGMLQRARPQLRHDMEQIVLISFVYVYRELDEDELLQYIGFASSPAGRAYHDAINASVRHAMVAASRRLADALPEAVRSAPDRTSS